MISSTTTVPCFHCSVCGYATLMQVNIRQCDVTKHQVVKPYAITFPIYNSSYVHKAPLCANVLAVNCPVLLGIPINKSYTCTAQYQNLLQTTQYTENTAPCPCKG